MCIRDSIGRELLAKYNMSVSMLYGNETADVQAGEAARAVQQWREGFVRARICRGERLHAL
eukprot:11525865-Alexandrium_andersonii.AAC.1